MMKVTDLKPLGARILVERGEAKKETDSGILIPDNSTEKPQDGVVIAVGPEVKDLRPGARVLLPKYGGTTIEEEGVEYTLISVEDVLGFYAATEIPEMPVADDDLDEDLGERQQCEEEVCESCQ